MPGLVAGVETGKMLVDSHMAEEESEHTVRGPVTACATATDRALSHNTVRALRSDLAIYKAWCDEHGVQGLPANAATIAAFVDAMAKERTPATVRRYIATVATAHRDIGQEDAVKSKEVREALRRMLRDNDERQAQAEGLTRELLERLLSATDDKLIDARNRVLLSAAYDTLMRRSELVAVQVCDIAVARDGAGTMLVRRSKTDQVGRGAMLYVGPDTMTLLHEWFERSGISDGKVFRSLTRGVLGESLHPGQIPRIFKAMALKAGLPAQIVTQISGHSTRVGAVQDMVAVGVEMGAILHAGRWKTMAMVSRYSERLIAQRSGSAQLARLQQRTQGKTGAALPYNVTGR